MNKETIKEVVRELGAGTQELAETRRLIEEYSAFEPAVKHVEGWICMAEAASLMLLAGHGAGEGAIVEIGSWMGLSTAWLASASSRCGREPVVAVDHFKGSPDQRGCFDVLKDGGSTLGHFLRNMESLGLSGHVRPVVSSSEDAAKSWDGSPIRLLFIDGEHTYEAAKNDFNMWGRHLVHGGMLAFHDVGPARPGLVRLVDEISGMDGFERIGQSASLAIISKG